jgi:hypothetical protein
MNLVHSFVPVTAALFVLGGGAANAGQTIDEAGGTQASRYGSAMRDHPRRSCRTKIHNGLRGKVRVYAR